MKNLRLFVRCNVVSHNVGEINEIMCVFTLYNVICYVLNLSNTSRLTSRRDQTIVSPYRKTNT